MHHSHHLSTQPSIAGQQGMMQQPRSATGQDLYATDVGAVGMVDPMLSMNRMQIPAIGKLRHTLFRT